MRYGMAIDLSKCVGCHTCSIACKSANNLPKGVLWNRIHTVGGEEMDTPSGTYPNCSLEFLPVQCQHCANPACVEACPTGASFKREDGIVSFSNDKCIGCEACIKACPYEGVRTLVEVEPEYYVDFPLGDNGVKQHLVNTVEKCTFCEQRIDRGETPACMVLCPARCRFWGDLDDPESEVSKAIAAKSYELYLEDQGTQPSIYYLR